MALFGAVLEAGVDRGLDPSMRRPSGVMMRSMMLHVLVIQEVAIDSMDLPGPLDVR